MTRYTNDVEATVHDVVTQLRERDPYDIIEEAGALHDTLLAALGEVAAARREAVRTLRMEGWTLTEIAERAGLSKQRIYQLEQGQDRKEKG